MFCAVRRFLAFGMASVLLLGGTSVYAAGPQTSAKAFILMDADSGRVLLEKNADQALPIASTTKIMTAYVALQNASMQDTVTVKREHLKEGSSMYLQEGETLTLEALLYGLMLPSGNDAAECIADFCGPERAAFVARMNKMAVELGMKSSSFANPSGLDEEGHSSCARDMATLAAKAMGNEDFLRLVSTIEASVGTRTLQNHNKLLETINGCIGLKTGYTSAAGRTLVTCCERGGLRLIAVTLHDRADWEDHTALYDYGFSTYERREVLRRGEVVAMLPVIGGTMSGVKIAAGEDVFLPLLAEEEVEFSLQLPDELMAPLSIGDAVGEAVVTIDGKEAMRLELVCAENVATAPVAVEKSIFARLFSAFTP